MDNLCPILKEKCAEANCAWWDPLEVQCAIVSIGIGVMENTRNQERNK